MLFLIVSYIQVNIIQLWQCVIYPCKSKSHSAAAVAAEYSVTIFSEYHFRKFNYIQKRKKTGIVFCFIYISIERKKNSFNWPLIMMIIDNDKNYGFSLSLLLPTTLEKIDSWQSIVLIVNLFLTVLVCVCVCVNGWLLI